MQMQWLKDTYNVTDTSKVFYFMRLEVLGNGFFHSFLNKCIFWASIKLSLFYKIKMSVLWWSDNKNWTINECILFNLLKYIFSAVCMEEQSFCYSYKKKRKEN